MIPVTGGTRMFLFRGWADMRKGFDGLSGMVEQRWFYVVLAEAG